MKRLFFIPLLFLSAVLYADELRPNLGNYIPAAVVSGDTIPVPSVVVSSDDFTDNSGINLNTHYSTGTVGISGYSWTKRGGPQNLNISGNAVVSAGNSDAADYYITYLPTATIYSVEATIQVDSSGQSASLLTIANDTVNAGYGFRWEGAGFRGYKFSGGTVIGTYVGTAPTVATVIKIVAKHTAGLTELWFYTGGVLRFTYHDTSSPLAKGFCGASNYYSDPQPTMDKLIVRE